MKAFVVLAMLAASAIADVEHRHIALKANKIQAQWVADPDVWTAQLPRATIKGMLGVDMDRREAKALPRRQFTAEQLAAVPESFDARENWPNCTTMQEIRDQATCGSCWAFGSVETMSDRECIVNNRIVRISAEDLNSCNTGNCGSCNGGYESCAFLYWVNTGLVSEDCMPYSIPSCDHHIVNSTNPCGETVPTPKCSRKCQEGFDGSYTGDKHYGARSYSVRGEKEMMAELVENGPFDVALQVYSDFMSYKSGIYHHATGLYEGGHAVKIIGWGVEKNEKYWLVANSWNPHWGEKGFFRIRKGNNECNIESQGVAGIPKKI